MSENSVYRPYADLLEEVRQKVEYLQEIFGLQQQQIAKTIKILNISRYVNREIPRPCRLSTLLKIVKGLHRHYDTQLAQWQPKLPLGKPDPENRLDQTEVLSSLYGIQSDVTLLHRRIDDLEGHVKELTGIIRKDGDN